MVTTKSKTFYRCIKISNFDFSLYTSFISIKYDYEQKGI